MNRLRVVVLTLAVASWSTAQACGGDSTQADAGPDATTDTGGGGDTGAGGDTGGGGDTGAGDTGAGDTGASDGGGGNDGGGGGLTFVCPGGDGGTVTSCAQCAGSPEPCVFCSANDASVLTGVCSTLGTSCGGLAPNNYQRCGCTTDAAVCPESYQVCRNGSCRTCAESPSNAGLTCQGGGTCDSVDGGCL